MQITEVKIFPVTDDKLKAYVTITLENCFVVRDLKIIRGAQGLFVAMPSKKRKDGSYKDIAHPLDAETRRRFEKIIIEKYKEEMAAAGGELEAPVREFGENDENGDND